MSLDSRTGLFLIAAASVTNTAAMFIGWRTYARQRQMAYWLASSVAVSTGLALMSLKGSVPAVVPVVAGNLSLLVGFWSMFIGFETVVDRPPSWRASLIAVAAAAAAHLSFYFVADVYAARIVVMSLALGGFPLAAAVVLGRAQNQPASGTRFVAMALLAGIGFVQLVRGVVAAVSPSMPDVLGASPFAVTNLAMGLMLWLLVSFVAMIMTGERLQEEARAARQALAESDGRALTASREREAYYRALLQNLPAGVVIHAPDTSILDCNEMACSLLGLTAEQMHGKTAIDPAWAFVGEDRIPMRLEEFPVHRVAATGRPLSGLVAGVRVPGRPQLTWVVCNAYPVSDVSGHVQQLVVTFVDVTRRIQSEEARHELEAKLRQSQKMEAVGQLASGIAHDFNNLLTVVTGIADLAIRTVPADDPMHRDLADIQSAGELAAGLTRQLLAFGRKQPLVPELLSLRSLIDELKPLLVRVIREDVQLVLEPGMAEGEVFVDPGQFEQVLLNLALNARDAMPHGGALSFTLTEVELDAAFVRTHEGLHAGTYARLAVRDSGTGMDEATTARIFEPFYTTKAAGRGTGLGLATAYGIVAQNGGAIEVESTVGIGTTFFIFLPLARGLPAAVMGKRRHVPVVHDNDPESDPFDELPMDVSTGTGTILVVEDEAAIRRLAKRVLEGAGYEVLTANDGVDALRVLAEHGSAVDLLLTDVIMPNMGGPELVAHIAEMYPATKVLYVSGYAGDADLHRDVVGLSDKFLSKPYRVSELTQKVAQIMKDGVT